MPSIREQYLFDYIVEEFGKSPQVRVRVAREDGILGVSVKTESREFFFPFEWASVQGMALVRNEIERIHSSLEHS